MTLNNMAKIGLDLTVTYRRNVKTSLADDWNYMSIDEYLDIIETDEKLKQIADRWNEKYNLIAGWASTSEGIMDDCLIFPQNLEGPLRIEYRESKLLLPCVHYFGRFLPPSNKISLIGEGNGVVVLDIDIKHIGGTDGIHSAFRDSIDAMINAFYSQHPSSIFLYETSSSLGYHIGYLTDAKNEVEYKQAFNQLVKELSNAIPLIQGEGIIDENVGRYSHNFFTNHSNLVLRKNPSVIFKPTASFVEPIFEQERHETQAQYDEFPYHIDFRLYLAYHKSDSEVYFHDRREWLTMIYALKAEFPGCYRSRMVDWFVKLSSLSPKFNEEEDVELFDDIMSSNTTQDAGIGFIIKVLNRGNVVSQFPKYTLDDLQNYFTDLSDKDSADSHASNFLFIERYLTEIKDSLNFSQNLIIESPPNTGKSTLFLQGVSFKRIYLVPTKVLLTDLAKNIPSAQIVQEGVLSDEINPEEVILSTYEGLEKILQSNIPLKEYKLIVDEAHNIFLSASLSFRFLSLHRICKSFHKFENTILLSGTWIDLPFSDEEFSLIKVKQRDPVSTELNIITTETPLDNLSKEVALETGKQIVLINNKDENIKLKELVLQNRPDATITLINADTKKSEEVKKILDDNHLQEGHVLIGTQMIVEGISFLDEDIKAIRFYRSMAAEHIAQLSFRARKSHLKPPVSFYQSRNEFFIRKDSNLSTVYEKLHQQSASKHWADLANQYVGNSAIRMAYERVIEWGKAMEFTVPLIFDKDVSDKPHISKIFLGHLSTSNVAEAMSSDLFSLLVALRKWNFTFRFSKAEKTSSRDEFKKLQTQQQKVFIGERLNELLNFSYEQVGQNKKSPIYKAWVLLQCVDVGYFNQWNPEHRINLFFDKRELHRFCDMVQGCAILKGKEFLELADLVSSKFYEQDEKILSRIKELKGYPSKISNESLEILETASLTQRRIKKVLSKYFDVSPSSPRKDENNVSVRYFRLADIYHDFEPYLRVDKMENFLKDRPF